MDHVWDTSKYHPKLFQSIDFVHTQHTCKYDDYANMLDGLRASSTWGHRGSVPHRSDTGQDAPLKQL